MLWNSTNIRSLKGLLIDSVLFTVTDISLQCENCIRSNHMKSIVSIVMQFPKCFVADDCFIAFISSFVIALYFHEVGRE